ncbi:MAG TPA: YihY/virulence factor BrkB family protein [Chloroflexota bacterium]
MTQPKSLAERAKAVTNERRALGAFIAKLRADNIGVLAGFVSWSILTSLVPIVVGVAALSGLLLQNPNLEDTVVDKLSAALQGVLSPHEIETIVQTATSRTGLLALIGFVGIFWGSANVGGAISTAFQSIFEVRGRPFVKQKLIDLGMLVILTATMLLVLGGSLASAFLNNLLGASLPEAVQFLIGTGISSTAAFALFASIYTVFPNIEAAYKVGNVWRGALPAAAMFQVVSYIWPIYVRLSHFSRYSAFLFSLLVLSTWIYFFAMILMVGAEVVAVSAIRKAQRQGEPVGPLPERTGPQHLVLRRGERRWTQDAPEPVPAPEVKEKSPERPE